MLFNASVDVLYEAELNERLDPNYQDSYYKVNVRLGLASKEQTWAVALIGKNLTDEITYGNGAGVGFLPALGLRTGRSREQLPWI